MFEKCAKEASGNKCLLQSLKDHAHRDTTQLSHFSVSTVFKKVQHGNAQGHDLWKMIEGEGTRLWYRRCACFAESKFGKKATYRVAKLEVSGPKKVVSYTEYEKPREYLENQGGDAQSNVQDCESSEKVKKKVWKIKTDAPNTKENKKTTKGWRNTCNIIGGSGKRPDYSADQGTSTKRMG